MDSQRTLATAAFNERPNVATPAGRRPGCRAGRGVLRAAIGPNALAATMSSGGEPPRPPRPPEGHGQQAPPRRPERPAPALPWAPQADVVRAAQRDADFVGQLQRDLATVVTSYVGTCGAAWANRARISSRWRLTGPEGRGLMRKEGRQGAARPPPGRTRWTAPPTRPTFLSPPASVRGRAARRTPSGVPWADGVAERQVVEGRGGRTADAGRRVLRPRHRGRPHRRAGLRAGPPPIDASAQAAARPADLSSRGPPVPRTRQQRMVHVVLHAAAPYLLITLARRAPDTAAAAPAGSADSSLWARLGAWASRLQAVLHDTLSPAHLMVFYFVGAFYYMSHRAAGLRYVRLGAQGALSAVAGAADRACVEAPGLAARRCLAVPFGAARSGSATRSWASPLPCSWPCGSRSTSAPDCPAQRRRHWAPRRSATRPRRHPRRRPRRSRSWTRRRACSASRRATCPPPRRVATSFAGRASANGSSARCARPCWLPGRRRVGG